MFDRTDVVWGAEGVVNDEGDVMAVCHFCYCFDIGDIGIGVAKGFGIYCLGSGLNGSFKCIKVVYIDNRVCHTLVGKCMGDEIERTTIEVIGSNDVVTVQYDVLQCVGYGSCSTGYSQSCHTAFQCGNADFEDSLG